MLAVWAERRPAVVVLTVWARRLAGVPAVSARQRPAAAVLAVWAERRPAVVVLVVVRQRPGAERRPADRAQAPAVLPRAAGARALPRAAAPASQPAVAPAVSQTSQQQAATLPVWPAWPRLAQLEVLSVWRQVQAMAVWPVLLLLLQAPSTARLPAGRSVATACLAALDPAPAVSWVLPLLRVPAKALLSACRSVMARAAGLALPAGASRAAPPDPASAPVPRACWRRVQTDFAA